jgi:hypothetical protein
MKKLAYAVSFFLLLVPALAAPDLTGKWSGSFLITGPDGQTKDDMAFMDLKQNGAELTGTAGPSPEQQWAIQKGKVEGNKITFEVQTDEPLLKFELTLIDGHLKGEAKGEHEGRTMKATLDLQRKVE